MARKKSSSLNDELLAAVSRGNQAAVSKSLAAGADANARIQDEKNNTLLTRALDVEEVDVASAPIIELLLRAGADPNQLNGDNEAPLNCAAEYADRPR